MYSLTAPKVKHNRELTGKLPKNFDPEILPDPREGFMLGVVAPRGSGKSFLLYNLLSKFYVNCFDHVQLYNPSLGNDLTLSPESLNLPTDCFFDKVDVDAIEKTIDDQIKEKKNYDQGKLAKKHLSRVLLVFDDCISDPNFTSNKNSNLLNMIAFKGRHLRISCIVVSQSYNAGFSKRMRTNIPNWIFFKCDNMKERKSIQEEQGGICREDKFMEMFDYATTYEDYSFFFIYGTCPNKTKKFRRNLDNILEYKI